jgi:aspartate/methionine/tyrosine aminotransferase
LQAEPPRPVAKLALVNPAVTAIEPSQIRAIHARKKPTSIDLGIGQPTLPPNMAHFEAATAWTAKHGCGYSPNAGETELREAIAAHYAYPGLNRAQSVCVTVGSQEAVYVAMTGLLDPAQDEVVIADPAFMVYSKIARLNGVRTKLAQLRAVDDFAFDADTILGAIGPRTRLIVICSPSNPTGRVISEQAVIEISKALLDRPGPPIYVLHDEIYRELIFTPGAGDFAKHYPYTIAINSLSKSNAMPGLRLGWMIAPADVMPELIKLHGWVSSCASTYAQRVALEVFQANDLRAHHTWYASQRDLVVELARSRGARHIVPEGAFYLCVDTGVPDDAAFAHALIDGADVLAIPASIFSSAMSGWLRTSFVAPFERYREGFDRLLAFAAEYRAVAV